MDALLREGADFAFETTLASRTFVGLIKRAQMAGYDFDLWFYALKTAELTEQRVAQRVAAGGHNSSLDVIESRHSAGIRKFQQLYLSLLTTWKFFDNSKGNPILIASKEASAALEIKLPHF